MSLWRQYLCPKSLSEAVQALNTLPGPATLIAGGTDLLVDLQQGNHPPVHTLVDVSAVAEMTRLELRGVEIFIGAALPLSRIAASKLVKQHAQALVEACNLIAGPQVRNVATLGGNVAHALPAADGTSALLALDAQAEIAAVSGTRRLPLGDLFLGPGKSILKNNEILVGFYIRTLQANEATKPGSAFKRIMRPQGVALPILNNAIWLLRQGEILEDIRIAVGPSAPTPQRMHAAEDVLRGQPMTEALCSQAITELLNAAHFRTSPHRASADYRRHLVEDLVKDTLHIAWERAR